MKKLVAEFIGTMWLVLGGCGSAVLAAGVPDIGIGLVGVSLAFGLTVLTGAYALGHISGGHFNPAVSVGLWIGGRFDKKDLLPYIGSQVLGGAFGAAILYLIISSSADFSGVGSAPGAFATNFYDANVYGVNFGVIGVYPEWTYYGSMIGGIHVDTRDKPARWIKIGSKYLELNKKNLNPYLKVLY